MVALVQAAPAAARDALAALAAPLLSLPRNGEELIRTVELFLRANGSTSAAARALFVHRNTVSYRLACVADLCGVGVASNAERVAWTLALVALGRRDVLAPL